MLIQNKHSSPAEAVEDIEQSPLKLAMKQAKERKAAAPPPAPVAPEAAPGMVECRGLKLCPNDNYLYAVVNGEKVTVRAGRRWAHRLTGKTFQAAPEIRADGETIYVYQP